MSDLEEMKKNSDAQCITLLPVMTRFQKAVFEQIKEQVGKVL